MPMNIDAGMRLEVTQPVMQGRVAMLMRLAGKGKRIWSKGRKTTTAGGAC